MGLCYKCFKIFGRKNVQSEKCFPSRQLEVWEYGRPVIVSEKFE